MNYRAVSEDGVLLGGLYEAVFIFGAIYLIAINTAATAAVIERDWKTPGDGLLTYDTVNKREWLDLSQALLSDQFPVSKSQRRFVESF